MGRSSIETPVTESGIGGFLPFDTSENGIKLPDWIKKTSSSNEGNRTKKDDDPEGGENEADSRKQAGSRAKADEKLIRKKLIAQKKCFILSKEGLFPSQ